MACCACKYRPAFGWNPKFLPDTKNKESNKKLRKNFRDFLMIEHANINWSKKEDFLLKWSLFFPEKVYTAVFIATFVLQLYKKVTRRCCALMRRGLVFLIMQNRVIVITVFLMLVAISSVFASEMPSFTLEEIIVTADAIKPAFSTDNINAKVVNPGQATSVPELLQQVTGIDVQLRGLSDNQDGTVKLRGFDARRFTVLVDGRPINMSGVMGGSYVNWNSIPLDIVDRIQIIKGAKVAAYGNTDGGVINIITKNHPQNGGNITLTAGQQGQRQYLFNYGGSEKRIGWSVYANKFGQDAFLRNNDYDQEQAGFKLNYDVTDNDIIKFNFNHGKEKRGFIIQNQSGVAGYDPNYPTVTAGNADSLIGNVTPNAGAYWQLFTNNWDAGWTHKTSKGFTTLSYWQNNEKRREVNYTAAGALSLDRTVISDISRGWQLSGEAKDGKNTFTYGADYKQMRYGYGWYDFGGGMALYPSQKVDLFGLYVDNTWSIDKRWTGNIGLRYDNMAGRPDATSTIRSEDYNAISPKLNFSFRNNKETTTFITVNRIWRAPSMAEFYWWATNYNGGFGIVGDHRDLKPEKGVGYEIGVERKASANYFTKVTVFYQDIQDYINFTHQWPFSCYNIDKAKLWGFEWENVYKLNQRSKIILNYTNQHTQKAGVSSADHLGLSGELDYRPEHKITLGYHYDIKPWQIRYNINYTGQQKSKLSNQLRKRCPNRRLCGS